jgi:hypothetical protein
MGSDTRKPEGFSTFYGHNLICSRAMASRPLRATTPLRRLRGSDIDDVTVG